MKKVFIMFGLFWILTSTALAASPELSVVRIGITKGSESVAVIQGAGEEAWRDYVGVSPIYTGYNSDDELLEALLEGREQVALSLPAESVLTAAARGEDIRILGIAGRFGGKSDKHLRVNAACGRFIMKYNKYARALENLTVETYETLYADDAVRERIASAIFFSPEELDNLIRHDYLRPQISLKDMRLLENMNDKISAMRGGHSKVISVRGVVYTNRSYELIPS